jgi:hypothetical protein
VVTAILSYVLPGRMAANGRALSAGEDQELEEIMEEEAELAGAGLVLAEAQHGAGSQEETR